ncbi:MAG TPA: SDR family oxidoreductase [Aliidongia sp.]|uniref:SDR family NAD(P)-dependent oxidoreductase n=1 Tax=Aliidongia sp. TaxID=1914230 RepID=UPI002DDD14D6|nr:SDR family oxidoreductase [Aliidongia sp.]HEV2674890.1 SDR family oxidoreductase [Aliidongia sp.]
MTDEPFDTSDADLAERSTGLASDLLKDRTVLVSGGGSGIGRATAWLAARLGARVIVSGRKQEKLDAVSVAIGARGLSCIGLPVDIRQRDTVERLFDQIRDSHGAIDILVNSAGGQFPQPAIDYSAKGWRAVIETNLDGTFNMMQCAAQRWRGQARGGSIVNVVVSPRGLHHVAHTCAARAGVMAFSDAVAIEWAPLGVRVNCVAPGAIRSEGWRVYPAEIARRYHNTNPMRQVGEPWDIAEACLYLAGPSGRFITGETLEVTGGGHLWGETWTTEKPDHFVQASRTFDPQGSGPSG